MSPQTIKAPRSDFGRQGLPYPPWMIMTALVTASAVAGVGMHLVVQFATMHALLVVGVGMTMAVRRRVEAAVLVAAYAAGSETLWRMTRARIPYELGKYAVIIILLYVLFTSAKLRRGTLALPLLYFGLMAPSVLRTLQTAHAGGREYVAFALSGPLALAVSVVFFSQFRARDAFVRRIYWALVLAATATTAAAAYNLVTASSSERDFTGASNTIASGGFGPVQVAAAIGLGVVGCIMLAISERNKGLRALEVVLALLMTTQTLLTFSRGGIYGIGIALAVLVFQGFKTRQAGAQTLFMVLVLLAIGAFVIVPFVNNFTSGAFADRFKDTETGRTALAATDLDVFHRNPIFGVGPGMTKFDRLGYDVCAGRTDNCDNEASSHTEYTRMLAEHGIFGSSLILLFAMVVKAYRQANHTGVQTRVAVLLAWSLAHMAYANLRLAAAAFVFGLAFLQPPDAEIQRSRFRRAGVARTSAVTANGARAPLARNTR